MTSRIDCSSTITWETFYAIEQTLYNSVLAGVSVDGKSFFYANPLRVLEPMPVNLRWSRTRPGRPRHTVDRALRNAGAACGDAPAIFWDVAAVRTRLKSGRWAETLALRPPRPRLPAAGRLALSTRACTHRERGAIQSLARVVE